MSDQLLAGTKLKPKTLETIQQRRQGVASTLEVTFEEQTNLELLTLSSLAGAVAFIGHEALPDKLNPVIKPVMEALKRQSSEDIQKTAARSLARILRSCSVRESSPNDKVVKNLCAFVCSNPEVTPVVSLAHIQGQVHPTDGVHQATSAKQLLTDLGIAGAEAEGEGSGPIVSQHRALVFCQLKTMLDIVESDLLRPHLPATTYLRLDGSVPAASRHSIVAKFNNDPSIDLLLLSTSVGGLGLNLTGADTVISVEHDWNPMKDLQAMDRAHRIGQRKVVNVYRLITRNTLEEKIMSLQQFKIHIAKSVISDDNSSLTSMNTDQVGVNIYKYFIRNFNI